MHTFIYDSNIIFDVVKICYVELFQFWRILKLKETTYSETKSFTVYTSSPII